MPPKTLAQEYENRSKALVEESQGETGPYVGELLQEATIWSQLSVAQAMTDVAEAIRSQNQAGH